MLCYVTPKEHLGLPDRDDVKDRRHHLRSPPMPAISPRAIRRRRCATTRSRARVSISAGGTSSISGSIPRRRGIPRRDAAKGRAQERAFLLHVRAEVLLDEDHAGHPRRGRRNGSAREGHGRKERGISGEGRQTLRVRKLRRQRRPGTYEVASLSIQYKAADSTRSIRTLGNIFLPLASL